ncbi:hypothetical protein G6F59_013976 [Rhizopus arrhizus]|nr:hypothetical protein G6F59_013976 [Rhizopus arrhizus]
MLELLGVQVLVPSDRYRYSRPGEGIQRAVHRSERTDARPWDAAAGALGEWSNSAWFDWNPDKRCTLPEIVPKVAAGVPSPIQLTPWKIGALKVLADIELDGFTPAQGVRAHGIDPRRFCASDGWLQQLGDGRWGRGTIPAFDQQHPEAFAQVLAEARARRTALAPCAPATAGRSPSLSRQRSAVVATGLQGRPASTPRPAACVRRHVGDERCVDEARAIHRQQDQSPACPARRYQGYRVQRGTQPRDPTR